MKYQSLWILLLLSMASNRSFAQEINLCDNLLSYTSQEEFIAHNIYKVIRLNFSEDGELDVLIEGDISKVDFSFTLIFVLPALQKDSLNNKIDFLYSNSSEKNIEEALVIEALKVLYPERLYEYLIDRAECLFELTWQDVLSKMKVDIAVVSRHIKDASFVKKVDKKFTSANKSRTKFSVNEIEFTLLREFYLDLDDPIMLDYFPSQEECDYLYCYAEVLDGDIKHDLKKGKIWETEIRANEPILNLNDIYVSLIACLDSDKSLMWRLYKKFVNPLDYISYALEKADYKILAMHAAGYGHLVANNHCTKRPCAHIERKEAKEGK